MRYAFDHFEIPYDLIYKERIRKGNLRADYDVIVIPSQGRGGAKSLVFDIEPRAGKPVAYNKTPEFPSLGMYGESDDITGGMGLEGVVELDKFVHEGGVLITLGASSFLPADFGITRERRCGAHRRRSSTRPARSWRPQSCGPSIRSSTDTRNTIFRCAGPAVRC